MHQPHDLFEGDRSLSASHPENAVLLIGPLDDVVQNIPIPAAYMGNALRLRELPCTRGNFVFRLPALCNVEQITGDLEPASALIDDQTGFVVEPVVVAVAVQEAILADAVSGA